MAEQVNKTAYCLEGRKYSRIAHFRVRSSGEPGLGVGTGEGEAPVTLS